MLHSGYVNSRCYILVTMSIPDVTLVTMSILDVTLVTMSILDVTLVAQSIAPQFWDKGGPLENYIRWRTHLCNTLCFWTFVSADLASGPFSQFIVYGQKLHNLTWFLIVFSGYPRLRLSLGYPIFGYPGLSSRSDFGSCLPCLY